VVAAGSLLELNLGDGQFSMPVGRVSFQHVEPMGFPEFLEAHGQQRLLRALGAWKPGAPPLPEAAQHQARRALELLAGARVCHLVRHSAANGLLAVLGAVGMRLSAEPGDLEAA
jgi:hypothetical protein